MCLIISAPKGTTIPPDWCANALINNPDGWGIMGSDRGQLRITKGTDWRQFADELVAFPCRTRHVHFRYATAGKKDTANCHPFPFADNRYALMHNGVISIPLRDKIHSDTWHFATDVLEPMLTAAPGLFDSPAFAPMLGTIVGASNKLVLLRADGKTVHVNRQQGTEKDGMWLSNTYSVLPPTPPVPSRFGKGFGLTDARGSLWDDWEETAETTVYGEPVPLDCPKDIFRFSEFSHSELVATCEYDAEGVADVIEDFLAQWAEWTADGYDTKQLDCR